jgi:hypothetical protein
MYMSNFRMKYVWYYIEMIINIAHCYLQLQW